MLRKFLTHMSLMKNPIAWYRFQIQRRVVGVYNRQKMAQKNVRKINKKESDYHQLIDKEDLTLLENFKSEGYICLTDILTAQEVKDINDYLEHQKMFDSYRLDLGEFDKNHVPLETHVGNFNSNVMINCPHIFYLANHPKILSLVTGYLGCKPTINNILGWRSFVINAEPEHPQNYHRDVDDWKLVKLFLYLTDVDMDSGPHYYIKGSAYNDKCTEIRRFTDDEIESAFGKETVVPHTGLKGTIILEDTYGVHKGAVPKSQDRSLIQIVYSLHPLPYSPIRPVKSLNGVINGEKFDKYINRVYIKQ